MLLFLNKKTALNMWSFLFDLEFVRSSPRLVGGDIWDSFDQFMKHGFREPAYIEHILLHDKTYGAELLPLYHKRLSQLPTTKVAGLRLGTAEVITART